MYHRTFIRTLASMASLLQLGCGGDTDTDAAESDIRELTIESGGLALAATLKLPQRSAGQAVPAVVLIHGSGPHSRNAALSGQLNMNFGFQVPVFEQLSAHLVSNGFAVLSYDKRSCGTFNGCADNDYPLPPTDITIDVFADDVEAASRHVAALDEIDSGRVFLVGHSQGAKLALDVIARFTDLRAGVMLAANHRPVDALLEYQVEFSRQLLSDAGVFQTEADQALASAVQLLDGARAARNGEAGSDPFLRSWIELDDRAPALVQSLGRPMLALAGAYDWNVPEEELRAWSRTFETAQNDPGHETLLLPCVTHALNCISQPDSSKLTPADIGRDVDPSVAEEVVAFLQAQQ